jgi:hypothetical protein
VFAFSSPDAPGLPPATDPRTTRSRQHEHALLIKEQRIVTHLVVVRRDDKDDGTLARDIVGTAGTDLSEEDGDNHPPKEKCTFVYEVRRHWERFIAFGASRHD